MSENKYVSYEWDEAKRDTNIAKHGIDFEDALSIFTGDHIFLPAISVTELRYRVVGQYKDVVITVVLTEREGGRVGRLISARRARQNEKREYYTRVR